MSLEEAVRELEEVFDWHLKRPGTLPSFVKALRVVLDELAALRECSSCKATGWEEK